MEKSKQYLKLLAILVLLAVSFMANAQTNVSEINLTLDKQHYTVYELLQEIMRQKDVSFSYNAAQVNGKQKVTIPERITSLGALLLLLRQRYNIKSKVSGSHIILSPSTNKRTKTTRKVKRAKKSKGKMTIANKAPIKPAPLPPPTLEYTPTAASDTLALSDSIAPANDSLQSLGSNGGGGGVAENIPYEAIKKTSGPGTVNRLKKISSSPHVGATLYTDDLFYLNGQVSLGHKWFYGTLAYAIKDGLNHFRYGLEANIPVAEKWSVNIFFNNGTPGFKDLSYTSFRDSIIPNDDSLSLGGDSLVSISSQGILSSYTKLFKLGASVSYAVNPRVQLSAGLVFNRARTRYYQNSAQVSLLSVFPGGFDEQQFDVLKPLAVLQNTFDNSGNTKMWLGVQASVTFLLFKKDD